MNVIDGITYMGSLDDYADRAAGWYRSPKLESVLLERAVLGGPLAINDGYLMHHPLLQKEILNEDVNSTFRMLVETGFVKVLKRDKNAQSLQTLIDNMQKARVKSFLDIPLDLKRRLNKRFADSWDRQLVRTQGFQDWPALDISKAVLPMLKIAIGPGTKNQVKAADGMVEPQIGINLAGDEEARFAEVSEKFFDPKAANAEDPPRTRWEDMIESGKRAGHFSDATARNLNGLAVEAYHYAWGACLAAEASTPVFVDTQESPAFHLLSPPAHLDVSVLKSKKLKILQIPSKLTLDAASLRNLLMPDGSLYGLKRAYLDQLQQLYQGTANASNVTDAARAYARGLAKSTGNHAWAEGVVNFTVVLIMVGGFVWVGGIAAGVAATTIAVGEKVIKLVYAAYEPKFLPRIARPLAVKAEELKLLKKVKNAEQFRKYTNIVPVDRKAAAEFVKDVKPIQV